MRITAEKVSCVTPQLVLTERNNNLVGGQINLFRDQNSQVAHIRNVFL